MSIEVEFLKKIQSIAVINRNLVKKNLLGDYKSAFRGMGMQFREFRPYVYGDDVRHIAWNVSARHAEPVIKIFEEERERSMVLLVDVSGSLRRGPWAEAKAERCAEVAATLALSAFESKDKLGLVLFSDRVEAVIPPMGGREHLLRVIRDVLVYPPRGALTAPDHAFRQLDHLLKKRSVVFYLSDMEELPSSHVIKRCASRHELVPIGIKRDQDWEFPPLGFLELETAEGGRLTTIQMRDGRLKDWAKQFQKRQCVEAEDHFKKAGTAMTWVDVNDDYVSVLRGIFQSRRGR